MHKVSKSVVDRKALRAFFPFDNLQEEYLQRVLAKVSVKTFPKGTLIFKRGKAMSETFYLIDGNVDLVNSQFEISSVSPESDDCRFPLIETSPTQVSAVAKSEVTLYAIERDFLDLVMAWSQTGDNSMTNTKKPTEVEESSGGGSDWMSSLLQSPLFTQVPPANIQQLFTRFETLTVDAGEVIIREGEPGKHFYVIEKGAAKVVRQNGKLEVALTAGHYFGEEALVGETTRNASVVMATSGTLMRLGKEDFKTLLQEPVIRFVDVEEVRQAQVKGVSLQLLDIRLPIEFRHHHVPESQNLPLSKLRSRFKDLDMSTQYVVADNAGRRSEVAAHLLCQAGFDAYILKNAD